MSVLAQLLASVTTTVAAGRSELRDVTESPVLPSGLDLDTVSRTIEVLIEKLKSKEVKLWGGNSSWGKGNRVGKDNYFTKKDF